MTIKTRFVLDTNVLISAALSPLGKPDRVLTHILAEGMLLASDETRTYAVASKLVGEAFVEDTGRTPLSPWYYASA